MLITEEKFAKAYDEHVDSIYRYCFFRLRNNHEMARDFTQETFIKAWKYIVEGNDIENLRALLYRIAGNLIIDNARKAQKRKEESIDNISPSVFIENDTQSKIQSNIDFKILMEAAAQLEDYYFDVFTLRFVEGYSPKEIANILNKSPNTVSVAITRAKKQLQQILYEQENNSDS